MEFEDKDHDLSYCAGDEDLEFIDWDGVTDIKILSDEINKKPEGKEKDFSSLMFLYELYGSDLDVR